MHRCGTGRRRRTLCRTVKRQTAKSAAQGTPGVAIAAHDDTNDQATAAKSARGFE